MFISIEVPDRGKPDTTITGSPNFQRLTTSVRRCPMDLLMDGRDAT
jgi:hypothetical protein